MKPEIIAAVTAEWNSINVDQQKHLMYRYLAQSGSLKGANWMGFLVNEFDLEEYPTGSFPPAAVIDAKDRYRRAG